MTDPLSVTASVSALISICAGSSKLLFRFITSVIDAPKEVRGIINSINGVNIALCQIQNLLLDLTYSSETALDDLGDLEASVTTCMVLFSVVDGDLEGVCQAAGDEFTVKKLWHQVKHVFEKQSLRDALVNLEAQKETLHLVLTALNSKSTANVLRLVKDTHSLVSRNQHVLKRLELQVTKVFEDAIGRSHKSQSTISLDSLCTPDEISRLFTSNGSTLSFTLTEMDESSASLIVVPDALSGVPCVPVRLEFPSDSVDHGDDEAGEQPVQPENWSGSRRAGGGLAARSRQRDTVDSYYNLADEQKAFSRASTTHQILASIQSTRVSRLANVLGKLAAVTPGTGNASNTWTFGVTFSFMNIATNILQAARASPISRSHMDHLQKASVRMLDLKFIMDATIPLTGPSAVEHVTKCQERVESTVKAYADAVQKIYKDSNKRNPFLEALRISVMNIDTLWSDVEESMDEMDRTVKFMLLLELKENADAAHEERRAADARMLDCLARLEAGQVRLESRVDGRALEGVGGDFQREQVDSGLRELVRKTL